MRGVWIVTCWLICSAIIHPGRADAQAPPAPPLDGRPEISQAKLECWKLFRMSRTPYASYAECSRLIVGRELREALGDADFVDQYLAQRTSLYRAVDIGTITLEEALQVMKAAVDTKYRRATA
jgi:hypothetical protein